ncbi:MAG: alpha/beta fold hydrolase [Bacteroidota bacterium]
MGRTIKRIGGACVTLTLVLMIYGFLRYQSDSFVRALVHNDESYLFFNPSTQIQSMDDLNYSETLLTVEDSIKIHTFLFDTKGEAKANVFLLRGNSGNTSQSKELIKPLVNNGFSVYSVDWRGYGKSNGVPNYKGVMKDTETAFIDFLRQTEKDSTKTIVYGLSLGGQLATHLTKNHPTEIDALVLDGALESAHSFIVDNFQEYDLQSFIRNPEEYNQDYVTIKDIVHIHDIPKLIIQSKRDRVVPIARGKGLFKMAKEPKVFWETNTEHIKTISDLPVGLIERLEAIIR